MNVDNIQVEKLLSDLEHRQSRSTSGTSPQKMKRCFGSCIIKFEDDQERVEDGEFVHWPHKIGNTILVYGQRSTKFPKQLVVGPDWPCMLVTYALIIVPTIFFILDVAELLHVAVIIITILTCLVTLLFFSMTACSDPGVIYKVIQRPILQQKPRLSRAVIPVADCGGSTNDNPNSIIKIGGDDLTAPLENDPESLGPLVIVDHSINNKGYSECPSASPSNNAGSYIECSLCQLERPRTASHCYDCNVCVDELDHHCPWTGKCIGKKNLQTFHLFLWTLSGHIVLVLGSFVYAVVNNMDVFKLHV